MTRFRGKLVAILAVIVLLLPGHLTEDLGEDKVCERAQAAARAQGLVGSFIKQCDENGKKFKTLQCWASTGYCYCAHPDSGEIYRETGLRSWEGERQEDCNTYYMTRSQGETNVVPEIDVITDKLLNAQQTTAGKYAEGDNQLHVDEVRGQQTTSAQTEQQGSSPVVQAQKSTPPAATQYAHGINDILFLVIVIGCSVLGVIGLGIAGYCWWKLQQNVKMAADQDYPAYGVTGPNAKTQMTAGDKKLAQSAQMYHYQHQKQQMLAMEKNHGDMKRTDSDDETEEETEEGDYTVYECPGLAPTGEMEVKNPLFDHDSQPPQGSTK